MRQSATVPADARPGPAALQIVTITVDGQAFGIPVLSVRDVLMEARLNRIPLAPHEVAGSLNLRGRIVVAIDMRRRLECTPRASVKPDMCVIVESGEELYALLVDEVGEVLTIDAGRIESSPPALSEAWRRFTGGLYQTEDSLVLILNVDGVIHASGDVPAQAA
jgi:purine-binding chemotaxis protein CheW